MVLTARPSGSGCPDVAADRPGSSAAALGAPRADLNAGRRGASTTWTAAGSPVPGPGLVPLVADGELRALAIGVLRELPPPVVFHLERHAQLFAVGGRVGGWWAWSSPPHAEAAEGRGVIVICWDAGPDAEERFVSTLKHEISHAFLEPSPPLQREPVTTKVMRETRERHDLRLRLGFQWGLVTKLTENEEAAERRACSLARAWGANGSSADGCACAAAVRRAITLEAAKEFDRSRGGRAPC